MGIVLVIYLFLTVLFVTLLFSLVFKNAGPWNNPMLFFIVLLMTVWTIYLWTNRITAASGSLPYVYIAILTLLIALILAASRTTLQQHLKIRRRRDNKLVQADTLAEEEFSGKIPNIYFWILLIIESLLILAAYILNYIGVTF
jgi:hypothetical protein